MTHITCGENAESLMAFVASRLGAEAMERTERHLEVCPACRELAAGQRAVWETLGAWEAPPVSADFDRRLYARIEREVSWWDRALRPFRPATIRWGLPVAAAAGLVVMAGAILVDRSAGVRSAPQKASIQLDSLRPDQAESALEDMEMLQEINGVVRPDPAASSM
jgi:anti-sigma factor RsiW